MATERQIAANRRNAEKSTGPRTTAGKKRSSGNAYRHGMTSRERAIASDAEDIEELALKFVGENRTSIALEWARTAAEAEVALLRVRRLRSAVIQEITRFGIAPADVPGSSVEEIRFLKRWIKRTKPPATGPGAGSNLKPSRAPGPANTEVLRPVVAHLEFLGRYEQRQWSRRENAIRLLRRAEQQTTYK